MQSVGKQPTTILVTLKDLQIKELQKPDIESLRSECCGLSIASIRNVEDSYTSRPVTLNLVQVDTRWYSI